MDVPFELWGQRGWAGVDIVGESHYTDAIREVFGPEFREDGSELVTSAQLVPEPWNRHDPNAVGVWVAGRQVGYLGRDEAARYAPVLSGLVAEGRAPQVAARVWAAARYGDRPGITGSVRIDLAEPHLIVPANRPPGTAHRVLPGGHAIQVTGEEKHLDALLPWLRPEGECWVHVTLHEMHEQLPRSTRELVEVRLDGAPIGRLSPKMSAELLPALRHLSQAGHLTAARALVRGNRIKVEVVVYAARAHELPESWLARPAPPDATIVAAASGAGDRAAARGVGERAAAGGVGERPVAGGVGERAVPAGGPGAVTVERSAGVAKPVVIPGGAWSGEPSPAVTVVLAEPAPPQHVQTPPRHVHISQQHVETPPQQIQTPMQHVQAPPQHGEIPARPAGIRFAVPPGWPQPPDGWSPPAGWRPDPDWPAAPADWQWWVPYWA
ncbi:HIRAN domain-containing protein [Actinoplanes sp. NPDC051343]|uniref:HIRAN domain-containing protein n=1 Tax=Actinoplanes sp. NPDC051343 TaxID=3363906 RepID=UPI0037879330